MRKSTAAKISLVIMVGSLIALLVLKSLVIQQNEQLGSAAGFKVLLLGEHGLYATPIVGFSYYLMTATSLASFIAVLIISRSK